MPRDVFPHVSIFARMRGRLSLTYTELQYWLLGLTHESYHLHQAGVWADLHRYERAISHLKRYLAVTENVTARSELAFYHSCLQEWPQAAQEYAKVTAIWPHPAVRLGHAEAELRLGNVAKAQEIIAAVETEFPELDEVTARARDEIKAEFRLGV
jgi:tetratricopeptide (TPR) repeat protein